VIQPLWFAFSNCTQRVTRQLVMVETGAFARDMTRKSNTM
jgi:hypothetical protein